MIILILFNISVFGFLFIKDPKLATAIAIGIVAALTVSGIISLVEKLVTRKTKEVCNETSCTSHRS